MIIIGEFRNPVPTGQDSSSNSSPDAFLLLKSPSGKKLNSTNDNVAQVPQILISTYPASPATQLEGTSGGECRVLCTEPLLESGEEILTDSEKLNHFEICQASLELLSKTATKDGKYYGLLTLALRKQQIPSTAEADSQELFSGSIFLLQSTNPNLVNSIILERAIVSDPQPSALHFHLLPAQIAESTEDDDTDEEHHTFINQLIVLSLGECITIHQIESTPSKSDEAKIEFVKSVRLLKNIWWAEWNPTHQFLAFAHTQKRASLFLEEENPGEENATSAQTQSILSVFQYHHQFQRESVLNFPLDNSFTVNEGESENSWSTMISNPMVISANNFIAKSLRLLTHSNGSVNLFYLREPTDESFLLAYNVLLLHHNKTLSVDIPVDAFKGSLANNGVDVDVGLCRNGEYLIVLIWPYFLHILDIGVKHEPSHHFVFTLNVILPGLAVNSTAQFLRLGKDDSASASSLHFIFSNLSFQTVELNATFFLSALRTSMAKHGSDLNLTLATMHALLLHFATPHAAKRLMGEMCKNVQNLHLTKIFQEFIVAYASSAIVKDLLPNMESFLYFIPYCPVPPQKIGGEKSRISIGETYFMKLEINAAKLSTALLSPSQRIFAHHVSDTWTSLWECNALLISSQPFCHKTIADKLLLSLQCYKPEALSRASTPMSPSSPMVCGSLGDIASMFGRRNQELQLPFVEHESCTANKQEYIFSINLRELSMHLLKERRDWPLACHTVAGKYVNALTDASRLLCHLISLTSVPQLAAVLRPKAKGYPLIDSLTAKQQLNLFILMEHFALAHGTIACPLPQGFTPFFAYLGYLVLRFEQFLWHVRCGTFDLQIDMVKTIMAGLSDLDDKDVEKKLQLISFLPKSRANRVLNSWSHPIAIGLRAKQHASDLLSGAAVTGYARKSQFSAQVHRVKSNASGRSNNDCSQGQGASAPGPGPSPLDTFFRLLTGKANPADIDLGLLTEATMLSMK